MAVYSVIILAARHEEVGALRGRGLDFHEREAGRQPDIGDYALPAIVSDDEIQRLKVEGCCASSGRMSSFTRSNGRPRRHLTSTASSVLSRFQVGPAGESAPRRQKWAIA
jgi:hypothetical protein